jgi:hypothetical protein
MASALRILTEQGDAPLKETPKATPTPSKPKVLSPELLSALVRLHGSGAKLSHPRVDTTGMTVDEVALEMRPRAANWGKDIRLAPKGGG